MTKWRDDFVSITTHTNTHNTHTHITYTHTPTGYLEEEVKKVHLELAPGGNVEGPDPQDMIDLEVTIFIAPGGRG